MTEKEALSKIQNICSRQEKCSSDVLQKLKEWEISEESAQIILKNLIRDKFVDDSRFAGAFVRDKFRFNAWGKMKIAIYLKMKKIDGELIRDALGQIDETEYLQFIESELKKKRKSIKDTDPYAVKGKLFRFGQARGFEADLLMRVLDRLV